MKNAMKKLMAFALVAVMLVGALPFAAFAAPVGSGCDSENVDACTVDFPNHHPDCARVCNGSDACYPGAVAGLTEYHIDGCLWLAAYEAAQAEAAKKDTNNCDKTESCPVIVPYHKEGCLAVSKSDVPVEDGKKCTNNYDCPHRGNLHEAGCPMIPCSSNDSCDHGGWNHTEDCPYACKNSGSCHADYHLDTCPKASNDKVEDDKENEEQTGEYITLDIYVDGDYETSYKFNYASATVNALLSNNWKSSWDFDYYLIGNSEVAKYDLSKTIYAGQAVSVYMETHVSKLNSNKVYLHVFMNNDFDDPVKNINITTGIAADGKVDLYSDVKSVIKEYFTAKDSDGIKYDGLYYSVGSWVGDFLADNKDETITNINELKEDGYVHLNVMITNAKLKSASTADSTNPKTGDNIFVAVSVMTIAAGALAVAFYLNKKRAV